MNARTHAHRTRLTVFFTLLSLGLFFYCSLPNDDIFAAGNEIAAVYRDGTLHVVVPDAQLPSAGRSISITIVDASDKTVATYQRATHSVLSDRWSVTVPVGEKLPLEDLAWHRMRIESGGVVKTVAVSSILRVPILKFFGQNSYAAGSTASVRVVAVDSRTGAPLPDSTVTIELGGENKVTELYSGRANRQGTVQADFEIPKDQLGSRQLLVRAVTPLGPVSLSQPVQITRRTRILLTTDKPLYQPGQMMHIRALAIDGPTRAVAGAQPCILEVEDAKGNKLFKQRGATDVYGITSADFELADEVNLGPWHVRAIVGEGDGAVTQEKTVTVDRYVLPKFKVEVELDGDASQQKSNYFAPGDTVSGRVVARYLFGKPLTNAEVTLVLTTFDVETAEIGRITGRTDAEGKFTFSTKLPDFLAGRSAEQGSAPVSIAAEVKDTADHIENKSRNILVSKTPIVVMAVPESGQMVPNLENRVYLLTSYPDGTPAETTVTGAAPTVIKTDASGVAEINLKADTKPVTLKLKAADAQGRSSESVITLEPRVGEQNLLLRTDRAVYKVGDTMRLETVSTRQRGPVYVDVVRDGQTLATRSVDSAAGRASLELDLTPEMYGPVEIRAYQITSDADPILDRRVVYVDPADDLKLEVSAERDSYKPAEEARIDFRVTDASGRPVSAAIGVEIVDEAVFALSEKHPGFEKVFLYLQEELLKPRFEVHQFDMDQVIVNEFDGPKPIQVDRRERAARILFAAAGELGRNDVRVEAGRERLEAKRNEYAQSYAQLVLAQAQKVAKSMSAWYGSHAASPEGFETDVRAFADASAANAETLLDPWGNRMRGQGMVAGATPAYILLNSNGADGRAGTDDDVMVQVYAADDASRPSPVHAQFSGNVTRAPGAVAGKRGQIDGRVVDDAGNALGGVRVATRRVSNGRTTTVLTDAGGGFTFLNLDPGRYDLVFEGSLYMTAVYKTLTLKAGDRATVESRLSPRGPVAIALTAQYTFGRAEDGPFDEEDGMMAFEQPVAGMAAPAGLANERRRDVALPRPMKAAAPAKPATLKDDVAVDAGPVESAGEASGGPRVRNFFPETLYVNPALVTDGQGLASIRVPLADSITTWRVTSLASTRSGLLGSSTAPVRVFQDFFIDLDLPVALTEGDVVSVPVAVYNYLQTPQMVSLEVRQDAWFALDADTSAKQVRVGAGEVSVAYFRIKAARIGQQELQVTARLDGRPGSEGDAVARTVEVRPNGEERAVVVNDRLEGSVEKEILLPENAIPDASKIFVKFYPGALSQVVEGLDSILQMPSGCFEQTSSSTYPNILVLDYLKTSKKLTPEIQAKAEGFIALGYQRLVTFEVQGGGFSWFGEAPANKILTAYGLMEFSDMSRVHEVDPRLIERTQNWLASQQRADGSFEPDKYSINEGATDHFQTDVVRITAYIGWALASTGYRGEAVDRARQYVVSHLTGREDAYTLAVIANFAADSNRDRAWTERSIDQLAAKATEDTKVAFWKQEGETPTYARQTSADLETTALAAQALLKAGRKPALAKKALDYLSSNKDQFGNWSTTQATILSLKAFVLSHTKGASTDTAGAIDVLVDGQAVDRVEISQENNDLLHMVDLKAYTHGGKHRVGLNFKGTGNMQYQIVGRYYVPWAQPAGQPTEPMSIDLGYDRTTLAQDETATARVRVRNNTRATARMVMVDLGIPPGFEPQGEDFAALVDSTRGRVGGKLEKYTITAKQVILYFDGLAPNQTVEFTYKLKAKFPLRAKSFASRVYQYYNPEIEDRVEPTEMTVKAK